MLQVPRTKWIEDAFERIEHASLFYFKDFKLSTRERSQIETTIEALAEQGKVKKYKAFDANWVRAALIRKLVMVALSDAFENGTMAWDVTLAKILSIVFTAAISGRLEQVTENSTIKCRLPFLRYRDILMKLEGGASLDNLEAMVTIRKENGATT